MANPVDRHLPETRFARAGDISIAYQVLGNGPLALVVVPGIVSHVEFAHELPGYTKVLERFASFSKVITFDKRGQGLSDRIEGAATLEERMDDLQAVMKATSCTKAALLGISEGASMAALYAATFPDRVSHLILYGGCARFSNCEDYKHIYDAELIRRSIPYWGKGLSIKTLAPSFADNPDWAGIWAKGERLCLSPGSYRAMLEANMQLDVRAVLPQIRTPTLVLHRALDLAVPVANGKYLAQHIPGARYIEYPKGDHVFTAVADLDGLCGDIEEFLTGSRYLSPTEYDRILATVMFTDIIDSTKRVAELGDKRWQALLDEHDQLARRLVEQHRGRFVKSTGDGVLATFDGPARAVRCAQAMSGAMRRLGIPIRVGVHTGEIENRVGDVAGITVHVAARIMASADAEEILVSRVVTDLVAGSGLSFGSYGMRSLKGVDGQWELFSVQTA
jgi:class 3 adenylate cyclase/pimeloyl-ACP methyl ester carboxylesterase